LSFIFLTGHPSDALPSRAILAYYEMANYKTIGGTDILARELQIDATGRFQQAKTGTLISNNIQLIVIPDKLVVYAKRTLSSIDTSYADTFLTIKGISVNF
jgi:hypothetical protein